MEKPYLELDAFVRAIGVNQGVKHMFFLGAGTSITSGLPSAENCIWEWKRAIFLTNNPTLQKQFSELSLESVRMKIQEWLDQKQEFPSLYAEDEYSFYIEKCYPSIENRRKYFEEKIRLAKPHTGYQLLCLFAEAQLVDMVWTSNFDSLVSRTAANFKLTPIEIGIDTQERILRTPSKGELLCVSLHGDYKYDKLKNTSKEVRLQEKILIEALTDRVVKAPLIVCGYSGRDKSIIDALRSGYSQKGKGTLYWCGFGSNISTDINELIELAKSFGHEAYFVPTQGFDDLMTRLSLYCLSAEYQEQCQKIISSQMIEGEIVGKFSIPENLKPSGLIKSNAFLVDLPSEVFEFDLKDWPPNIWEWLDSTTKNTQIVAVPYRRKILCLGNLDEIRKVFGSSISNKVVRAPIGDGDLRDDNSVVNSLLRKALVRAISISCALPSDGKGLIWEKGFEQRQENQGSYHVHKAVLIFLRRIGVKIYMVLKPTLYVTDTSGVEANEEVSKVIKIKVLGFQHNKEFSEELDNWKNKFLDKKQPTTFEFPPLSGSHFSFTIQKLPIYAELREKTSPAISLGKWQSLIQHTGFVLDEPDLLFSSRMGNGNSKDKHPLHGLVNNRPYDYSLNQLGFTQINLGVVCPDASAPFLENFLFNSQQKFSPMTKEADYLIDFPGFSQAFGLGLDIPKQGSSGWQSTPEIPASLDAKSGALKLSNNITAAIDGLYASHKPNVAIIFIPNRWQEWRKFETDDESFDLHDFVKAYCVQRGISTQFIEEQTLNNPYKCRVWWWLSVALYSKAMRTPWVLDTLDSNTAFVGLGFSLRHNVEKGKQIVLGCSHIYNSQGEGLRFRLSKIQNPIWIRHNPYMSRDDARQVGETIRTLFYESRSKLPERVVIHKLTPFRRDERDGLMDGLKGVVHVDMIEINIDDALRYFASRYDFTQKSFSIDMFPVKRGTVIPIDDYSALLWAHGSTKAVQPGRTYFQGKRRIPAPLIIRRYSGNSDLSLIANEILGLSKMDWNSADLYTKLPVTVYSSQRIARIGTLLQRFEPTSYDYRLFI
jgi:hypothetical protein